MSANLIKKSAVALAITASFIAVSAQSTEYTSAKNLSLEILKVESHNRELKNKTALREYPNYFIVKLESKPLTSISASANADVKGNRLNLSTSSAKKHMDVLAKERAQFASVLKASMPGAKVERHYDTVFNGVVVTSTKDIYDTLLALQGVTRVFREELYHANMDASLSLINATKVWEQMGGSANAGKGVKVAVIDTGIRPENPMFADDSGFVAPEGLPTDDYCRTSAPDFCNNKLIVARSPLPTFEVHPDEHSSPLGYGSHGSHVAGTAVGNPVSITHEGVDVDISGVAPGAYLMVYKGLFTTPEGGGSGSNVMLLEMLDWAVKDGADVINNSWGGGAGAHPSSSPYGDAFLAAEEAGVVVVSAAGNDGPDAQSIGCPSCIESGITVANTTHGRFFGNSVDVAGDSFLAVEANNGLLEESVTLPVVAALNAEETNFEGCSAYADNYFTDSIALVSRGACAFSDKTANAMAAGAEGIIVYNNKDAAPFTMYQPDAELPSLMISKADGEAIIDSLGDEAVTVTMNAEVSRIVSEQYADNMADSSSRGPNGDNDSLKPDIAAPGTNILSAYSPDDSGVNFGTLTGTSMASPHVAGAAAVMKSLHSDWSATDIKTALTSTSKTTGLVKEDVVTAVDAFDVGAGRLDLEMASKAVVTFDKPSFAKNPCVGSCTFTRTINNMDDSEAEWEASVSFTNPEITGQVSPSMVTLAAMGSEDGAMAEFSLEVDSRFGKFDTWEFGQVIWKDKLGQNADVHMPVAIFASTSADSAMLSTFATESEAMNGAAFEINAAFNNVEFSNQVAVKATPPEGTTIVVGSESSTVVNGTEFLLDHDEIANSITWTGRLAKPEMTSSAAGGISYILAENGGTMLTCGGECDETAITLNFGAPAYKFNGAMYETITISDNGIIRAGSGSTAGSWNNQNLPDSAAPNEVIAPFWTDFDLNGTDNTSGGGDLYYDFLTTGSGATYFVVEWYKAQPWNDPQAREYTFQAWIALGDEEDVFFNYPDLDSSLPSNLTVGVENSTGSVGISHYYNGEGSAPVSGSSVNLNIVAGGGVSLNYMLTATAELDLGVADTATVIEDGAAVSIDVLANENMSETKSLAIEVMHEGARVNAVDTVEITANGDYDLATLEVSEPANGVATVTAEGKVEYTPNADFSGTDTFTYQVKDQVGTAIKATTVSVDVTPVNDAPTLADGSTKSVRKGKVVNLSVTGSDVDGDSLTYTWKQVSGTQVSASSTTNTIKFTAPSKGEETITFEVTASDGEFTSNTATVSAKVINSPSDGGSMGWLSLALLPLVWLRRKKISK